MTEEFVVELLGIDQLSETHMKEVYDLWSLKRHRFGYFPSWHDFSISEIAENMPHLSVVDYVEQEDRFRVRFSGSEYDDLVGRDVTGTYFDEMPDGQNVEERARRVKNDGRPIVMEGLPLTWASQDGRRYKAFSLPLQTNPSGPVDQLLYMLVLD